MNVVFIALWCPVAVAMTCRKPLITDVAERVPSPISASLGEADPALDSQDPGSQTLLTKTVATRTFDGVVGKRFFVLATAARFRVIKAHFV